MRFGFFRRRKQREIKKLSLDEVEQKIIEEIEGNKKLVEDIIGDYSEKLGSLVNELVQELKKFDPSSLHPRLAGIAKNFKSSMLELWSKELDYEKIRKNMEKVALFKLKHFKLLFGVNPEEISRINEILGEIADVVSTIEGKTNSIAFNELNIAMENVNRLRDIHKNKRKLEEDKRKLMEKLNDYGNVVKETSKIESKVQKVEEEIKDLELEITRKEDYVKKLIATVRKPIKSFAHDVGSKIDFNDFDGLQSISKKVMVEMAKGRIRVKSRQTDNILLALKEIGDGRLSKEMGEVNALKKALADKKLELQKLRSKIPKFDVNSIKKEIESIDNKIERLNEEYDKIKALLESRLSKIFGFDVVIEE
ncbi:hypothetical protein DRP05_09685 [Archaeoglobales archaeon]|nr:MAG: hypothetical protein DRP05_09685 [Archaeoglobales archaeon]